MAHLLLYMRYKKFYPDSESYLQEAYYNTIITHRKNMMEKCNAKNAVELVANAIRKSII